MEEVEDPVSAQITESWIMLISEQHRYQGVSYKSDITLISGQSGEGKGRVHYSFIRKCLDSPPPPPLSGLPPFF